MMNPSPKRIFPVILVLLFAVSASAYASEPAGEFGPGRRVLLDAHNCYPYQGRWNDRLDRAFATGLPIAIEQDLIWRADQRAGGGTGQARSIVSHGEPFTGREPTLEEHFFEWIRPIVEEALAGDDKRYWPLITLNIDFKDNETAHLREIRSLFEKFSAWISWAEKMADAAEVSPIRVRPLLVLVGGSGAQQRVFHDEVRTGDRIRAFGAARTNAISDDDLSREERAELRVSTPPAQILSAPADNWRRWWNNSWHVVEAGGAPVARDWTAQDAQRLADLVTHAHTLGYWIRFYTLNGHAPSEGQGWSAGYNLGSPGAARARWRAARDAGVDFMASDQYEQAAEVLGREP